VIVVLDSGIWISAFQFGGTPQAAVDSVFNDRTIAICDQIIAEVRATLVRKFSWKDEEVLAILTEYTNDGKRVAVKAEGEIILSGDNDLLSVKAFRGIQVLTVRQYLDRFTSPPA
jgi:predicted nucleic acid-binding protein